MSRPRADLGWLYPFGIGLAATLVIGAVRATLDADNQRVKETSDVYVLPPPDTVVLLSGGYRSALVDLLWSHVLVSQGLHTFEKRRFENLSLFLDSINALEPTFRDPYLLADALFTFQTSVTPEPEIRKAREVMERGAAALPLDGELWVTLGQFVAFVAPSSYLSDPAEQQRWRNDGANMLARAAELGGGDSGISWRAIGGAGIFTRAGEREAAIRFLQRTLAVTDDPELKAKIQGQLDKLAGEQELEAYKQRRRAFDAIYRKDLPFVALTTFLILGPPIEPARCTGPEQANSARCATTWRDWSDHFQQQPR